MTEITLVAQVFGMFSALSMMMSNWQDTKNKMLFCLLFDSIFCILQYILLGAFAGACTNIISLIRVIIFSKRDTNKYFSKNNVLHIIILLYVIMGIVTYDGMMSMLPSIATIMYTIVLWQDNPTKIRCGSSIMFLMWFIYNLTVGAYISSIVEAISLISAIASIIKIDIINNKKMLFNFIHVKES